MQSAPETAAKEDPASAGFRDWVPIRASLQVDALALGDYSGALKRHILLRTETLLESMEVLPATEPGDLRLKLKVVQSVDNDGDPAYRATFYATRFGDEVQGTMRRFDCTLCTEGELIAGIEKHLRAFLSSDQVRQIFEDPDPAKPEVARVNKRKSLVKGRGLAVAGFTVAGFGLLTTAAGTTLTAIGDRHQLGQWEKDRKALVNFRTPAGYIVLGVGAAVLSTGVALIVADLKRHGRSRRGDTRNLKSAYRLEWQGTGFRF